MFHAFLAWWGGQLLGLLPAGWRGGSGDASSGNAVLVTVETLSPARVTVGVRRRGRVASLGAFALDGAGLPALPRSARGLPVHVVLPGRTLLEQQVTLPLAAERGVDGALRFEMDRLTPFRAEDIHWSWAVKRRDRATGKLIVRLLLAPRRLVDPVLDALRAAGLPPAVLRAEPDREIPLAAGRAGPWRDRLEAGLAVACAVLLVAAAAIPFWRQHETAGRIEAEIARLRPLVAEADALRRRLQEGAASADVLAAERGRVGDALRALAGVTDLLPDDTYLVEFALRDRVLTLAGKSAGAARLIPALAADGGFRDPVFTSPVTRSELSGTEEFSIRAEVAR